jgi:hypothetical protein
MIAGTTGFRVRKSLADTSYTRGDGEFTGNLDPGFAGGISDVFSRGLSGHMHFWRLANRCFDGYSALKKDPSTAAATKMEFHSLKDDLHLTVVPREFSLDRSSSRERVTYRYNIRLAVVGPAKSDIDVRSPDANLLQTFKNGIVKMRRAVQSLSAAIDDFTACVDDLRRSVSSAIGLIDDVRGIIDSATDLLDGRKRFFDLPAQILLATADLAASVAALAKAAAPVPAGTVSLQQEQVIQNCWEIEDNILRVRIAAQDYFREPFDEVARKYERAVEGHRQGKDETRDALAQSLQEDAVAGQGRLTVDQVFGGPVRPGDVTRGQTDPIVSRTRLPPGRFSGYKEVVVEQGDSVESLAAKHMGDARDWPAIVIANQLKPPYITAGAQMPGTLQIGSRAIIPIPATLSNPDTLTTGEATLGESQAENLLGVDFERVLQPNGQFGWVVDTTGGSVDARKIKGLPNLGQGLEGRLRTEQGQNILYPGFGPPRVVGTRNLEDETANARYEYRRQILADPRIQRLASISFLLNGDALEVEASVQPVGFTSTRTISRTLT